MDRFGPCSACPSQGINCVNDTAILAPSYYWNWTNPSDKDSYKNFVKNIHCFGSDYDKKFYKFPLSLPKTVKCPYSGSCKGGIDSECGEGYKGDLCAICTNGYYLRFNTCLKCPGITVSIISSLLMIALFVVVFLMVLWGDSKKTVDNRTVADVVMSCFKIVIGFYQVIGGIFSALARVQWPLTLISMERWLKLFEGNVFQFAPLSCIYPKLRLDQFSKFISVVSVNLLVIGLILIYLFLKKRHIKRKLDYSRSEQKRAVSGLKKSCYRNIFLFLLASYSMTSKIIIQILPLPGACVTHCFTDDKNHCISLLKADYSIECFTARHKLYWPIAAAFALYPLGFPLLMLLLVYKYRERQADEEIVFGLKMFFENYKKKFWFWEITEMYRKLILISLIFIFDSESLSQIGITVFTVSAFGVAYTFFRPIKAKFEDRLQTFVLWVIFFDVCLGAMYTTCDVTHRHKGNDSVLVNVLFVVLNSSVLLVALGENCYHFNTLFYPVSAHLNIMNYCSPLYLCFICFSYWVSCYLNLFLFRTEQSFFVSRGLMLNCPCDI